MHTPGVLITVLLCLTTNFFANASGDDQTDLAYIPEVEKFSKARICLGAQCKILDSPVSVRSRIECVAACFRDISCRGAVFNGSCFHLTDACFFSATCQHNQIPLYALERATCLNGGEWNSTSGRCRCYSGWVGSSCERLASSCLELQTSGYPPDFYSTLLNLQNDTTSQPQKVYCTLSQDHSVLTYLFRSTGKEDHNRTWAEYSEGYVINDGNLWLGLDNMAALTAKEGYDVVGISVILRSGAQERTFVLIYNNFRVADFRKQYRYTVDTPPTYADSGDLGSQQDLLDILGPNQNTPFSTYDDDNDSDLTHNCARLAGAGWWFTTCGDWIGTDAPISDDVDVIAANATNRVNPLGWEPTAKPPTGSDDHDLLFLPGLDLQDAELSGTLLVINAYFYQQPPSP